MAKIKVHLINVHNAVSHATIIVENTSTNPSMFYEIDRWKKPEEEWSQKPQEILARRSVSIHTFEIQADPQDIVTQWTQYCKDTPGEPLGNNCAVATQWFLSKYASIPSPNNSNLSLNLMAGLIFWPSFIPSPVALPGRIISNAKFYLDARSHPSVMDFYTKIFVNSSLMLLSLAGTAAVAGNISPTNSANENIGLTAAATAGAGLVYTFFANTYNLVSARAHQDFEDTRQAPRNYK